MKKRNIFRKLAAVGAAAALSAALCAGAYAETGETHDRPAFQYFDGFFRLYDAQNAIPDLNATAGGSTAFLLQLNRKAIEENGGYEIEFKFSHDQGNIRSVTYSGTEIPDHGIAPDAALTGYVGGFDVSEIAVLPVNLRELLDKAGLSAPEVEDLTVYGSEYIEYIAIGTYIDESYVKSQQEPETPEQNITAQDEQKRSPDTGAADAAATAAGSGIAAAGAFIIAKKYRK